MTQAVEQGPEASEAAFTVFRIGAAWVAVPAERTVRVVELPHLVPVPIAPPALLGVANAGGRLLSVLDLGLLLGLVRGEKEGARCLVVSSQEGDVALSVDGVEAVTAVPTADVRASGEDGRGFSAGAFTLADRHVTVLDVERIIEAVESSMLGH